MKYLLLVIAAFFANNLLNAQDLAINNNVTSAIVTKQLTIPSNIVYTKEVNNLPQDAKEWCIDFAKRTNYVNTIYTLGKKHFPKVNKIFAKYNVPTELNVLLAIESFFNKNCVSSAGAVGYWQFMNQTAIEYGLSIDSINDERKDFTKSTKAAAQYLKNSYAALHDWYLAVASYNCGVGNVKKAIKKSGKSNPSFFEIKTFLPKETQNYVMKYIALNVLYKNYNLYTSSKMQWFDTTKIVTEEVETPTTTYLNETLQEKK